MDWTAIFPQGAKLCRIHAQHMVYQLDFSDGKGVMEAYEVFPGILLIFNDFHTEQGFQNERARPGIIEINHCRCGRYGCTLQSGRQVTLGAQDLSISDMGRPCRNSVFLSGDYTGISLVLQLKEAARSWRDILGQTTDLVACLEAQLYSDEVLLLRANPKIQHIVLELYQPPDNYQLAYYKIKALELLLFLAVSSEQQGRMARPYHCGHDAEKVTAIERRMTENLRRRHSLTELAVEFGMGVTTLKKLFYQQYGQPPYQYLRRRRMEEAALLLQSTQLPVGHIAELVGYQNASKFSAAFTRVYGMTPKIYRGTAQLEQNDCLELGKNRDEAV